ncbi:MAG: 50S ribosomal protein L19 [Deltaproteobacteria bacterium]|nr:50S ribosomal protein L19 [Deltaproteobacteria bacterium]
MTNPVDQIEQSYLRELPPIEIGDTVRVHTKIREGDKERIQIFEGVVLRWKRGGLRSTVTVRKVSHGVGVERIFPVHAPTIDKIEVKSRGRVRRARLYYLRDLAGKAARIKARSGLGESEGEAAPTPTKE